MLRYIRSKRAFIIKIIVVLISVGYLLSGIEFTLNSYSVYSNTISVKNDKNAVEVKSIDSDDNIILSDNTVIKGKDIKSYAKIKRGNGTFYIKENNCLVVEMVNSDYIKIISTMLIYTIMSIGTLIVGVLKKWFLNKKYRIIYPIYVALLTAFLWGYVLCVVLL